jgi:hypothetical protein
MPKPQEASPTHAKRSVQCSQCGAINQLPTYHRNRILQCRRCKEPIVAISCKRPVGSRIRLNASTIIFAVSLGLLILFAVNIYYPLRLPAVGESSHNEPKESLQHQLAVISRLMESNMNSSGYKTYCNTILNEWGTIDIIMTSRSFNDSASSEAIDNYVAAAVATVGGVTRVTNQGKWKSRNLVIKVGFGKRYEISTSDCRKAVELFRYGRYQQASDYTFSHLRRIEGN